MDEQLWIEWLDIRDGITCTGNCRAKRFKPKRIQLTKDCKHPEAQWLWKTLKHCRSLSEVIRTLETDDDPRAPVYVWCFEDFDPEVATDIEALRVAAKNGYSFAHCLLALHIWNNHGAKQDWKPHAEIAAQHNEREVISMLAFEALYLIDDDNAYRRCMIRSADLGCHYPMEKCSQSNWIDDDIRVVRYKCKLFKDGKISDDAMEGFIRDELREYRDVANRDGRCIAEIFNPPGMPFRVKSNSLVCRIDEAYRMVVRWERKAREAIDAWTLCAKRLGFYKDAYLIVSRILWSNRIEFFSLRK